MKKRVIILLGPPGSGKGTQAVRLGKEFSLPHISTGDLLRANIRNNTELGQRAKVYMDKGLLGPDDLILDMLFDRVSQLDCDKGYLLDGFPRTIPQAEALDKKLSVGTQEIALNLNVADEVIVKRAEGRLTCSKCGHIYNKYFSPSKINGKCDKCGSDLIQRNDDSALVVKERLKVYHDQTAPLIAYYARKKILTTVNGENAPDTVFKELIEAIQAF